MNPLYEIVIWTANVENVRKPFSICNSAQVADPELNKVDPNHYIDDRIYYNKQYYEESNQTDHGTYIKVSSLFKFIGPFLARQRLVKDNLHR